MEEISRIIFVSGHGVCRAPMAAVILRSMLNKNIEIKARGRNVAFPEPINQKMDAVMKVNGFECDGYDVAVQLRDEDINDTTLVFTFDAKQRDLLIENTEGCNADNTFVLSVYVGDELDIMNPYGGNLQAYGLCFEMMNNTVTKLAAMLNNDSKLQERENSNE